MSYRKLTQTLFRIDAVIASTEPAGRAVCALPDCWADALTWMSPYCTREHEAQALELRRAARQAAAVAEVVHPAPTADERAIRNDLAESLARRRAQLADVREADELLPDTLDDQDRAALRSVRRAPLVDVDAVRAEVQRRSRTDNSQAAFALQPATGAPVLTAEEAADALGLPLPPRPTATKPRPRPRPPWWRRAFRRAP